MDLTLENIVADLVSEIGYFSEIVCSVVGYLKVFCL
jgi:hypothetical protein